MSSYLTLRELAELEHSSLSRATPFAIRDVSRSQLSIAREYGGCRYNGASYVYQTETDELIRRDVLQFVEKKRRQRKDVL